MKNEIIEMSSYKMEDIFYMGKTRRKLIINDNIVIGDYWTIDAVCEKCNEPYKVQFRHFNEDCICGSCQKRETISKQTEEHKIKSLKKAQQTRYLKYGDKNFNNREKAKKTTIDLYGVDNPAKIEEAKEKSKHTRFKKYGEYFVNNKKSKLTKFQKYGDENYNNQEKTRKTNLERYGVECGWNNDEIKEKCNKTRKQLYGDSEMFKTDYFKNKSKETFIEKYGVDHQLKVPKFKEKIKQTNIEKYGVECIFADKEIRKKIVLKRFEDGTYSSGGRTKWVEYNGQKVQGQFELRFAKFLDSVGIKWVSHKGIETFKYTGLDGEEHYYQPDFKDEKGTYYDPHSTYYWSEKFEHKISEVRKNYPDKTFIVFHEDNYTETCKEIMDSVR